MNLRRLVLAVSMCVLAASCSDSKECSLDDEGSCPSDQVCEAVQGKDKPMCFAPVLLEGRVYDLATAAGIGGALVLASDENGAPAGLAVKSASDGSYQLRVPSTRTGEDGAFVSRKVMLRSQARNYLAFPSGARLSLPIDTSAATREEEGAPYVLSTVQTDVGLSPVEAAAQGLPTVSGTVEISADQKAVLLALEDSAGQGRTALADADGAFAFFNVPAGIYQLSAYSRGVNYTGQAVTVAAADVAGLVVAKSAAGTATLSGKVQLVAGAAQGTSVVLALESTFIETLGRGEVVPGLRAPEPGTAATLTGDWTISGIPDGKYVVLAAFENDGNVRDPDPGISGTQILHLTVSGGTVDGTVTADGFKVTAAVGLVSPGKDGPEATGATPTFTWSAYSNAEGYVLTVYDVLGEEVWTQSLGDKSIVSAPYAGPALTPGDFYQWRVTALRKGLPTSQTEELRGVFYVQ